MAGASFSPYPTPVGRKRKAGPVGWGPGWGKRESDGGQGAGCATPSGHPFACKRGWVLPPGIDGPASPRAPCTAAREDGPLARGVPNAFQRPEPWRGATSLLGCGGPSSKTESSSSVPPPLPGHRIPRGRSPSVKRRAPSARERAPQAQKRPPFICSMTTDEWGAPCAAATCPSGRGRTCAPGFRRFRAPFESGPVSLYSSSNWPV